MTSLGPLVLLDDDTLVIKSTLKVGEYAIPYEVKVKELDKEIQHLSLTPADKEEFNKLFPEEVSYSWEDDCLIITPNKIKGTGVDK